MLLATLAVAGCSSADVVGLSRNAAPPGATIAFESMDGPPPEVFDRLVGAINDEAQRRRVPVVSRGNAATFRVRGYVSALVSRNGTSFAWVWDVYDADGRRAVRLSGEQPAEPGRKRDAWTAANAALLTKIALSSVGQMANFLAGGTAPSVPEPAIRGGTLMASRSGAISDAGSAATDGRSVRP